MLSIIFKRTYRIKQRLQLLKRLQKFQRIFLENSLTSFDPGLKFDHVCFILEIALILNPAKSPIHVL